MYIHTYLHSTSLIMMEQIALVISCLSTVQILPELVFLPWKGKNENSFLAMVIYWMSTGHTDTPPPSFSLDSQITHLSRFLVEIQAQIYCPVSKAATSKCNSFYVLGIYAIFTEYTQCFYGFNRKSKKTYRPKPCYWCDGS